jgi:hypothetical protein
MNRFEVRTVPVNGQDKAVSAASSKWEAFRGLLWWEWYVHGKLLLSFIAAWLAGVWVLPLYATPAWILLFGGIYALVAGPVFGGSDTIDGCEEFTFALPPTRAERYAARLAVAGGALLLFTAMDLLALGLDLPQILAKLYVDYGLIQPRPILKTGLLYGIVLTLPLAAFAVSFALSAVTHSRWTILIASFWALVATLGGLCIGFWYEDLIWGKLNGYFACPFLGAFAIATLWAGRHVYLRKEIGHQAAPLTLPARWWLWIVVLFCGVLLGALVAASLAKHWASLLTEWF